MRCGLYVSEFIGNTITRLYSSNSFPSHTNGIYFRLRFKHLPSALDINMFTPPPPIPLFFPLKNKERELLVLSKVTKMFILQGVLRVCNLYNFKHIFALSFIFLPIISFLYVLVSYFYLIFTFRPLILHFSP